MSPPTTPRISDVTKALVEVRLRAASYKEGYERALRDLAGALGQDIAERDLAGPEDSKVPESDALWDLVLCCIQRGRDIRFDYVDGRFRIVTRDAEDHGASTYWSGATLPQAVNAARRDFLGGPK